MKAPIYQYSSENVQHTMKQYQFSAVLIIILKMAIKVKYNPPLQCDELC